MHRLVLISVIVGLAGTLADADPGAWSAEGVEDRLETILGGLRGGGGASEASGKLDALFDDCAADAPLSEAGLLRDVARHRRLVAALADAGEGTREAVGPFLAEHEELAATLAFVLETPGDDPGGALDVLARLLRARGDRVARYPELVCAICVVHDTPFPTGAAGPLTTEPDPVRVFDHLTSNARAVGFGPEATPAELLVHVVDTAVGESELAWAFQRHSGDRLVGKRYHDVTYDTRYFKMGAEKKIAEHEYTLENIRRYGGVCVDQAYYAATIGKAIGVPTVTVSGTAGELGHCWVGFLRADGGRLRWDFEEGRWEDFEDVRGRVRDPQTGRMVSDDDVAMTAELALTDREARRTATALLDAARRVDDDERRQALLRRAASLSPADGRVWREAAALASSGALGPAQLREWADALHGHFGARYPSFTIEVLRPMIAAIEDTREQSRLWDWAYRHFQRQDDLACEVLIAHAAMWEREGDRARAYDAYRDATWRYINKSAAAIEALRRAERLLTRNGKSSYVLGLYEEAWRRVQRPSLSSEQFVRGTNWYKIGSAYARLLGRAGRGADAARILRRIGAGR